MVARSAPDNQSVHVCVYVTFIYGFTCFDCLFWATFYGVNAYSSFKDNLEILVN